MPETAEREYQRGQKDGEIAGQINARLADHDRHFAAINGSVAKVAQELHGLNLAVQRLADSNIARDERVLATASALKDADDTRRAQITDRWSPWEKGIALVVAVTAVAGAAGTVAIFFGFK